MVLGYTRKRNAEVSHVGRSGVSRRQKRRYFFLLSFPRMIFYLLVLLGVGSFALIIWVALSKERNDREWFSVVSDATANTRQFQVENELLVEGLKGTNDSDPTFEAQSAYCAMCLNGAVVFWSAAQHTISYSSETVTPTNTILGTQSMSKQVVCPKSNSPLHLVTFDDCITHLHSLGLDRTAPSHRRQWDEDSEQHCVTAVEMHPSPDQFPEVLKAVSSSICVVPVAQLRYPLSTQNNTSAIRVSLARLTQWSPRTLELQKSSAARSDVLEQVTQRSPPSQKEQLNIRLEDGALRISVTGPMSRELSCPPSFLSVKLGNYGRHHNQIQELFNGVALARRVNRTFLLPPLIGASHIPSLRTSAEVFYNFDELRRSGHCIVGYDDVREILQVLDRADGMSVPSIQLIHYTGKTSDDCYVLQKCDPDMFANIRYRAWGNLYQDLSTKTATTMINIDALFAASPLPEKPVPPPYKKTLLMKEVPPPRGKITFPKTRWLRLQKRTADLIEFLLQPSQGESVSDQKVKSAGPPSLVLLSSETAFHIRPGLDEMVKLLALLEPSAAIQAELDSFNHSFVTKIRPDDYPLHIGDVGEMWNTVGLHVRQREKTCAKEVKSLFGTIIFFTRDIYAIDGADGIGEAGTGTWEGKPWTTAEDIVYDCQWKASDLMQLFQRYSALTPHSSRNESGGTAEEVKKIGSRPQLQETPVRVFVAYDYESGAAVKGFTDALKNDPQLPYQIRNPSAKIIFSYSKRLSQPIHLAFRDLKKKMKLDRAGSNTAQNAEEGTYSIVLKEIQAVVVDFFMLSNTGVFRGNTLSSVSQNVCLRRWGRGLSCHGIIPAYYWMLYDGTW